MNNIYPFKAIMPMGGLEYNIQNKFIFCPHSKFNYSFESYDSKLEYINNLLKERYLHKHINESFYCCRISKDNFSVIGLIALINAGLVNKKIFQHERCISTKEGTYLEYFKKYKTQISPIILIHEDNFQIKRYLNKITSQKPPFFTIKDDEYKYEIWTINDILFYKELYNTINSFLIADGHHRLSSINLLGPNKLITAFLTSVSYIKSANIYREYFKVDNLYKEKLLLFLKTNFNLIKIRDIKTLSFNEFLFKINSNIYLIENSSSNDYPRRNILEFLDKYINYKNNKLNFYNYLYNKNNNLLLNNKDDVSVLIPAFKINKIDKLSLYPPHSTLFYPKLPDGLISVNIE